MTAQRSRFAYELRRDACSYGRQARVCVLAVGLCAAVAHGEEALSLLAAADHDEL
jgi:hypothetical protein